jgi:hypothetical protein
MTPARVRLRSHVVASAQRLSRATRPVFRAVLFDLEELEETGSRLARRGVDGAHLIPSSDRLVVQGGGAPDLDLDRVSAQLKAEEQ